MQIECDGALKRPRGPPNGYSGCFCYILYPKNTSYFVSSIRSFRPHASTSFELVSKTPAHPHSAKTMDSRLSSQSPSDGSGFVWTRVACSRKGCFLLNRMGCPFNQTLNFATDIGEPAAIQSRNKPSPMTWMPAVMQTTMIVSEDIV